MNDQSWPRISDWRLRSTGLEYDIIDLCDDVARNAFSRILYPARGCFTRHLLVPNFLEIADALYTEEPDANDP